MRINLPGLPMLAAAALLWAQSAPAQRVVVLEFAGDPKGKLRAQVEAALGRAREVELVPLKQYKSAAAKKKIRGAAAMTPPAVAKLGRILKLDAAVEGAVGDTFLVRILDGAGELLWSKDLPVKRGLVSKSHAQKLARAIAVAAGKAPKPEVAAEPPAGPPPELAPEEPPPEKPPAEQPPPVSSTGTETSMPAVDLSTGTVDRRPDEASSPTEVVASAESERDIDLDLEGRRRGGRPTPRLVSVWLTGTVTWRTYCARPGVRTCAEFNDLPEPKPKGDRVNFYPDAPYLGGNAEAEIFPLAWHGSPLRGLGVVAGYSRGFPRTRVTIDGDTSPDNARIVTSVDEGFSAQGSFRYFFTMGKGRQAALGYLGIRGGVAGHNFDVDPESQVPLPGSHRVFPMAGVDFSIPIASSVHVLGGGSFLIGPKAGPDEIAGFGDFSHETGGATAWGISARAGILWNFWGPLGLAVRFNLEAYGDEFFGPGQKWPCNETQCGGAAQETYSWVTPGLTVSF
ncbi:MAG: hypothetical protein HYZ28_17400 [Myxococcales bacterium]|nr:hypothetical protein [Myxococcales bacterium]